MQVPFLRALLLLPLLASSSFLPSIPNFRREVPFPRRNTNSNLPTSQDQLRTSQTDPPGTGNRRPQTRNSNGTTTPLYPTLRDQKQETFLDCLSPIRASCRCGESETTVNISLARRITDGGHGQCQTFSGSAPHFQLLRRVISVATNLAWGILTATLLAGMCRGGTQGEARSESPVASSITDGGHGQCQTFSGSAPHFQLLRSVISVATNLA